MRKKKIYRNQLLAPVLLLICLSMGILNLLSPDKSFSDAENRTLQSFPGLRLAGLGNGSSQQSLDTWYADQFAGRQTDFHISYLLSKLFGQREINDVFLGKGALLAQSNEPKGYTWQDNAEILAKFAARTQLPVTAMVVPNAASVQPQKLPAFAPVTSQMDIIGSIYEHMGDVRTVDVRDPLSQNAKEYIYYKTDHHWTTLGAGLAWEQFAHARDLSYASTDYTYMPVSNSFTGTLAGKTGSVGLADAIDIAVAKQNPEYLVTWADGSKTTSIYKEEALNQRDQYQLFLGANQAVVHIDTTVSNEKHLLVLKDSYANSMIQYMLPYYQSITIVDPRYFYEDLSTLISLNNITEVALIMSCDTFVTDSTLQAVLKTAWNQTGDSSASGTQNKTGNTDPAADPEETNGENGSDTGTDTGDPADAEDPASTTSDTSKEDTDGNRDDANDGSQENSDTLDSSNPENPDTNP